MSYVIIFASLLLLMQQVDHTSLFFSVCCFFFIIVSGITFNLAGGMVNPSGGYVFFYAVLTVIVGLVWKAVLGEPAETNLLEARLTIEVFLGGICAMFVAVLVSRRLTRKRALLAHLGDLDNLQSASTGCLILGLSLYLLASILQRQNGTVFSALLQINRFNEMAIILGVTYQIRKSGGRSSINLPAIGASLVLWIDGGLLSFSKQAMFTPFICWALAAGAQGYRVSKAQAVGGVAVLLFMFQFMVPYAQYGRSQGAGSLGANIDVSIRLLSDLGAVRARYLESTRASSLEIRNGYYNTPQGFFDRLQMMFPDSTLVEATERLGQFGLYPILTDFENLVPHVFWADKPVVKWGNVFAHDTLTPLDEEDETTGISYSPTGEAYRLGKWVGVLVLAPIIWTMTFVWFDSLCGDVRKSPWGLLALTLFAHNAPEGMLDGCIYMMGFGAISIIFAALSAAYVLPHVGILFSGPGGRNRFIKTNVRSLPRRVSTLESSEAPGS
ncbi:MAG: hypothetical protein NVSMB3_08730 [Acidobacteriaceae bacterium]